MKNLLSENMMRFGTKNLSEAAKKELTLKSIIETINEHGLQKEVRKALSEVMIQGVESKYPFTDEAQLQQYFGLMAFDRNIATKLMGDYVGLSALHTALLYQTAIEGIKPGQLPAEKAKSVAMRYKNLSENDKQYLQGAFQNPNWIKWYTGTWLPKWKKAYLTIFPPQPAGTAVAQAPQVPGKM